MTTAVALFCGVLHAGEPVVRDPEPPRPLPADQPKIRYWLDEKDPVGGEPIRSPRSTGNNGSPGNTPPVLAPQDPDLEVLVPPQPPRPLVYDREKELEASRKRGELQKTINNFIEEAKVAYKKKDYERVVGIAKSILQADPRNVPAAEYLRKSLGKIQDVDENIAYIASERRDREAMLEAAEHAVRPPPRLPAVRPYFPRRSDDPSTIRRKRMNELVDQRLEMVNFLNADLEWVLTTLFAITGVNIVADPAAIEGKKLTLQVQDIPLREVLEFIIRNNEGIQYSITENAVWVTATEEADLKKIMYFKVYPLHYGLVSTAAGNGMSSGGQQGGGGGGFGGGGGTGRARGGGGGRQGGGQGQGQGGKQGKQDEEASYIETVMKWIKDAKDPHMFPEGSDYLVDRQSNNMIVFTTPSGHDKILGILDQFDQPAIQVLVKTRFLDIQAENEKSLGVNLDKLSTKVGGFDANGNAIAAPTGTGTGTGTGTTTTPTEIFNPRYALGLGANGLGTQPINIPGNLGNGLLFNVIGRRTDPQFQVSLAALLANRQTKILSEPMVLAVNNKEAVIDVTTHFSYITELEPVTTTTAVGNGTATQNVSAFVPQFEDENIGFTLVVTPSVGRDLKTINMHLSPVIDSLAQGQQITQFQNFDVTQTNTSGGNQTPPTIQRPTIDQTSLETDVVLEDNGYVIIGGLIRHRSEVRERKVPGLYKIPFLGELFKSKSTGVTKSNLMIIVEAQIMSPSGRSYYKEPVLDDADPREGGTNRAPGQVSEVDSPDHSDAVNYALGLPNTRVQPKPVNDEYSRAFPQPANPKDAAAQYMEDSKNRDMAKRQRPAYPYGKVEMKSAASQDPDTTRRKMLEELGRAKAASSQKGAQAKPGWAVPDEEK